MEAPHIIRRPVRTLITALALAPAALGLAACGGSDDEEGSSGPPATFQKGQTVAVKGSEYRFEPGNVVIEGGGGPVTFELENTGSLAHNLRVFSGGRDIGGTPTFTGGETETGRVRLAPGEYEMVCTVGDHADLGMTGKLTVR
jgi:plastocyanin